MSVVETTEGPGICVGTLIIGAGQAGVQLAASLRELGCDEPITLIGGEPRQPYQRPPLSKSFLQGKDPEEFLLLRGPDFYRDNGIDVLSGEQVRSLRLSDPKTGSGEAITQSGSRLKFDRLALTVGGTPRRMEVPGHELAGIHYLRTAEDALALRQELEGARHVVVVGGGYIGLEAAATASAAGSQVTVVEAADRLLARAVDPIVSEFYAAAHRRRGMTLMLGTGVAGFAGARRVESVVLADGRALPAEVVVIGIGLVPQTNLAEQLGLTCHGGIVVDDAARTSIPSIVAAGDCTVLADPAHGQMLRLESVPNAIAQAKIAAATLLGKSSPPRETPWFWSDQGDLKLQSAGLKIGYNGVVLRGNPSTEAFSVLYYRGDQLVAVDAVNAPRDYMAIRRILDVKGNVPPSAAGDQRVPLKEFLKPSGQARKAPVG